MKGSLIGKSPWYQLFIVFFIAIGGTFLFLLLGLALVPLFFPYGFEELPTLLQDLGSGSTVELLKFLQGFNTLGTFLAPGLVGAYLLSRNPSGFLEVNSFPRQSALIVFIVIILTVSGTSVSDGLYRLTSEIEFPDFLKWLETSLEQSEHFLREQMSSFLKMDSFMDFLEVFIIMALLPAVCEETLFRGVVQPLFIRGFGNIHFGIIITSLIFGIAHQQFYSFLSITALSIVLGYLKEWSRSLWVPVIMHLINNGSIVVAIYFFNLPLDQVNAADPGWDPIFFLAGSGIFILSLIAVYKLMRAQHKKE